MIPAGVLAAIAATAVLGALIGTIGYLLKGRFDEASAAGAALVVRIDRLDEKLQHNTGEIVKLTEAQKAVVANQTAQSRIATQIIDDSDDLADKVDQLNHATGRLFERWDQSVEYRKTLGEGTAPMGGG